MKPRAFTVALLLFLSLMALSAAQKTLPSNHVPAWVARGKSAPLGRMAGTNQLTLALSLPLREAAALTNLLREIYDPTSPQYRRYLTPAEFAERFGPTPADYAKVLQFARTNGFKVVATHPNRLVLEVTARSADTERAFHVRLNSFKHPRESRNFFAPDTDPTVDAALPILRVSGLDNYALPQPRSKLMPATARPSINPRGGSGPSGRFIGNDFRQAYVPGTTLTGAGQSVGLLQFDGFHPSDITNYANLIGLTNLPPLTVVPVNGGVSTPGGGEIEVALDIEMVLAMAPGISNIYVYEAPNPSPWVSLLSRMANDNLSRQLSCSWGGGGPDSAAEQIFLQMAAQGQTFFNAAGDSDAFVGAVDFPAESPNITQVGGTTLSTDGSGNYVSETAWNRGGNVGGGGGISTVYPLPVWQQGISMAANQGSTGWRNMPDVALVADNIHIFYGNGTNANVGGTSCAAPLWAAFLALANQRAAQISQPPVGFLNPTIYALNRGTNYSATFHDITTGDNTSSASPTNFYAVTGFDLCTGWGTPTGTNLINALNTPDALGLSPQTVASFGAVSGPFSPASWVIHLTNSGATNLAWGAGDYPAWLTISTNAGTLHANGSTDLIVQLSGASGLLSGRYVAAITFTNALQSRLKNVVVSLTIGESIVQNGSFETGDFTDWTLVGDTYVGNLFYNVVATEFDFPGIVHSGTYGAFLGEGGFLATLTQNLPTIVQQKYLVSFWLNNPASGFGQEFIARWNGADLMHLVDPPVFGWTNYQFVVSATATNTDLEFAERNDPNYFGMDDVSVVPVPPVRFSQVALSGNDVQLSWNSLAGLRYQIESKTNLTAAVWQSLASVTAGTNLASFANTNVLNADRQRFYRLVLLP